jgi:hypothetical protein
MIHCWPTAAAYHAYWRARGYGVARKAALIILCAGVAGGVGGAGTIIRHALTGSGYGSSGNASEGVRLDAP